jgi:hypothetical protein
MAPRRYDTETVSGGLVTVPTAERDVPTSARLEGVHGWLECRYPPQIPASALEAASVADIEGLGGSWRMVAAGWEIHGGLVWTLAWIASGWLGCRFGLARLDDDAIGWAWGRAGSNSI